jgi:hypothetical protein
VNSPTMPNGETDFSSMRTFERIFGSMNMWIKAATKVRVVASACLATTGYAGRSASPEPIASTQLDGT